VDALGAVIGFIVGLLAGVLVAWYYLGRREHELRVELESCRRGMASSGERSAVAASQGTGAVGTWADALGGSGGPGVVAVRRADVSPQPAQASGAFAGGEASLTPESPPEREAAPTDVDRLRDPLIDILGIGPVFQTRLYEAGILTFAELAALSPEQVRAIIKPASWQKIEPGAWIAEAGDRSR
jgi:predicted flap endonuclease-1-like 5' DNA nuclease